MKYIYLPYLRMFNFKGTATRKEFWIFFCFHTILKIFVFLALKKMFQVSFINYILFYSIPLEIPFYAIGFRRLRDADLSSFLFLIPIFFVQATLASMPSKK